MEARRIRESTIADLARVFDEGCPIALLPIYPFPEYDSPNDANGDYGLFDLPLWDNYGFRWSYGAIKNTSAARHYAPLISQQPPFARASLKYQIQYWDALRPCGAVIDRTYLYAEELEELETMRAKSRPECLRPLMGEKFNGAARFIMINFSKAVCQVRIDDLTSQLVTMAIDNEILWQPITVGIKRYERYWAMMPRESSHQLMYSVRGSRPSLDVLLSVLVLEEGKPFATMPIELCITSQQSKSLNGRDVLSKLTRTQSEETTCHQLITSSAGLMELPLTLFASDQLHSMLSVSIAANSDTPLEFGAILLPSNPNSAN